MKTQKLQHKSQKGQNSMNSGSGNGKFVVLQKFATSEISQVAKMCNLRNFAALLLFFLLLSASLFFWFFIYSYELNLDSPWLS